MAVSAVLDSGAALLAAKPAEENPFSEAASARASEQAGGTAPARQQPQSAPAPSGSPDANTIIEQAIAPLVARSVSIEIAGKPARKLSVSRGEVPEGSTLLLLLNSRVIIVRYNDDAPGHYLPNQEVKLADLIFRTFGDGYSFLQEVSGGKIHFYDEQLAAYTGSFSRSGVLGEGRRTSDVLAASYLKWRKEQGVQGERIYAEIDQLAKLGIGILDAREDYAKGHRQIVHIYDDAGVMVGDLYVSKEGPNLANIGGQWFAHYTDGSGAGVLVSFDELKTDTEKRMRVFPKTSTDSCQAFLEIGGGKVSDPEITFDGNGVMQVRPGAMGFAFRPSSLRSPPP